MLTWINASCWNSIIYRTKNKPNQNKTKPPCKEVHFECFVSFFPSPVLAVRALCDSVKVIQKQTLPPFPPSLYLLKYKYKLIYIWHGSKLEKRILYADDTTLFPVSSPSNKFLRLWRGTWQGPPLGVIFGAWNLMLIKRIPWTSADPVPRIYLLLLCIFLVNRLIMLLCSTLDSKLTFEEPQVYV